MTPERDDIFSEAREISDPAQRSQFVADACGEDAALRLAVEAMLQDAEKAAAFFESNETESTLRVGSETPGTVIGRYKLLEKIGEGGMGVVYMAEQREPVVRKVALKIIKAGMDTRQVVARFEAERQALALMDHPNIAKVLDGGATNSGRPYFVMELVQGVAITQFCDQNELALGDRLQLFINVCQAVQHAHQKGIIHRDLKPSNVLVTMHHGVAHPMVIDFGVAKAIDQNLTEKTLFTNFGTLIGTPAYMSPEQAEMSKLDVDTRADIYSLGVLLYELLTGTTPFAEDRLRSVAYGEMQRILLEEEPERPSTRLKKRLTVDSARRATLSPIDSDLDWIVMKCLEKDRNRRFETANGLAADIQRYLSNEAVIARPPSAGYRFQKLVRRNKLAFVAGMMLVATLLFGVVISTLQAIRATRAERRQNAEAERARRNLYAADMLLAQQALDENNWGQVQQLLRRHIPRPGESDLRGWEWRYLWKQSRSEALYEVGRHENSVSGMALSSNGRLLASIGYDQAVRLFEVSSRREIACFRATKTHPLSTARYDWPWIEFSPRGDVLGISGRGSGLTLLKVPSLQPLHESALALSNAVSGFSLDGGGQEVLVLLRDELVGYNLSSRERRWAETVPVGSVGKLSPNGRFLARADRDGTVAGVPEFNVRLWDRKEKRDLVIWRQRLWGAGEIAFSPNNRYVAIGGGQTNTTVIVFDLLQERERWHAEVDASFVTAVAFSSDSQTLATSSNDHEVRFWNVEDGMQLSSLRGHRDEPWVLAYSIDSSTAFIGDKQGTITAWSAQPKPRLGTLRRLPEKSSSCISQDGQSMIIVTATNWVEFIHGATARSRWRLTTPENTPFAMNLSSGGKLLAVAPNRGPIELWDPAASKRLLTLEPMPSDVVDLVFSGSNEFLAALTKRSCAVWRVPSGELLFSLDLSFKNPTVLALDHSARRLAVGSNDGRIEAWHLGSRRRIMNVTAHRYNISGLAFSPTGNLLASTSNDTLVKVFDVVTGETTATLLGHRNNMERVYFSPDGKRLIATGGQDWVYLFETEEFQRVGLIKLDFPGSTPWRAGGLLFAWLTADGKYLIAHGPLGIYSLSAPSLAEIDAVLR